jgi:serine/threonine protein phosphatase PrpC
VGFHEPPIPDYRAIAVEEGMRLLICSDGLTKELTSYGIRHFLVANQKAEKAARQLLEAAIGNGGRDNVTVVVVDVVKVARPVGIQPSSGGETARA